MQVLKPVHKPFKTLWTEAEKNQLKFEAKKNKFEAILTLIC